MGIFEKTIKNKTTEKLRKKGVLKGKQLKISAKNHLGLSDGNVVVLLRKKVKVIFQSWWKRINFQKIKLKPKRLSIVIFIIIGIIMGIVGVSYGAVYYKTSKLINEAKQLAKKEKYNEAINKLNLAQASWFVEELSINKQNIIDERAKNEQLFQDKSKYEQGLDEFNKNNLQGSIDILSELSENSFYYQKSQTKIEESKRMMVEEELGETKIAKKEAEEKTQQEIIKRGQAEAKAKQEEFEKKLKEQQLASKEAEEKRMNADNDGDGLTYREELDLGTSDYNVDSDNDGINDKEDSHPAGGSRLMAQHFEWNYGGKNWTWDYSFPSDWYDYYKNKKHGPNSVDYVTSDDTYIKQIAEMLKKEADNNNYTKSEFAAAFIQSLGYVADTVIGYDDYPKYPIETLAEQNGDCEDTSYLSAAIIVAMNLDVKLVLLPGHMAIAVAFSGSPDGYFYPLSNGRDYYFIETTGENFKVGQMSNDYRYSSATLVGIPFGDEVSVYPQYNKPCNPTTGFSGYYYDGSNYYSDSQCNYQTTCLLYSGYYFDVSTEKLYHDSSCSQIVVKGCYKSKTYPGYFYISGLSWYYDSRCTQTYKSMICTYPYSYSYTCTQEYQYTSKQSYCGSVRALCASSGMLGSPSCGSTACLEELNKCRSDINEYQSKLSEYNGCFSGKEY